MPVSMYKAHEEGRLGYYVYTGHRPAYGDGISVVASTALGAMRTACNNDVKGACEGAQVLIKLSCSYHSIKCTSKQVTKLATIMTYICKLGGTLTSTDWYTVDAVDWVLAMS